MGVSPLPVRRTDLRRLAHRSAARRLSAASRADRVADRRIRLQAAAGPGHGEHRSRAAERSSAAMTVIHKTAHDLRVTPNLSDYDRTRAEFDWSDIADPCAGMPS